MKKIILIILLFGYPLFLQAQDESYRGGSGDGHSTLFIGTAFTNPTSFQPFIGGDANGYAHDSLINFTQYATINMFAPFVGSNGDGYAHDSLMNFNQHAYITMFMPYGGGSADGWVGYPVFGVVLPVELLSFSGKQQGKVNLLQWQTSTEQNVSHFDIERSANARQFISLGRVAAAGNSSTVKDYSFTDVLPEKGHNFYRLKMVDADGSFKYSNVILLKRVDDNSIIALYPNPAREAIHISLSGDNDNSAVQASLFDRSGKLVRSLQWKKSNTIQSIEIGSLATGVYTLRIVNNGNTTSWSFIKQ